MRNTKLIVTILIAAIILGVGGYAASQQFASPSPTPNPSTSPTSTATPFVSSSQNPTQSPTASQLPTSSPTFNPTATPTIAPTSTTSPSSTSTPTVTFTPSPATTPTPTLAPTINPTPTASPTPQITFPLSVIDDTKTTVTITSYPLRIVSLAPSTTEMIYGLGLFDKVVGVVTYSGYDPSIQNAIKNQNITTVGTFNKVNVELVTGLQPDIIIASGAYQQSLAEAFASRGKTMVILNPAKFSEILADIKLLGKITGTDATATALVNSMQSRVDAVISKTNNLAKPSVYVEYYVDKSGYSSYGANSYINELISMAGGVNVFAGFNGQYITTSTEEILKANPSIIVISDGVMSKMAGITPDAIKIREGWSSISALQNNRIFKVDESLITIWGPRIVDGLEALAKVIHPEVFNATATASPAIAFP